MVQGDDMSITQMKFILYIFEWLSGLKINYHKSVSYIFGKEEEDKIWIANMLNCKLRELSMKYLGIPISDRKMGMGAEVHEKISKRIPPWKEKYVFKGQVDFYQ
jgi:hypothetical protein